MKNKIFFSSLFLAVVLVIGCSESEGPLTTDNQSLGGQTLQYLVDPYGTPVEVTLYAGQDMEVGTVTVENNDQYLEVTYEITDPDWYFTETHLAVSTTLAGIPQTKSGNPKVGNFPYSNELDPPDQMDVYTIELEWGYGTELYIAAHAVVEKETVLMPAPYEGFSIQDYGQGLKKNGTPVDANRSDPNQILIPGNGDIGTFFSLGFGGWIIVEFDCPVVNGDGPDVLVTETTWGTTYPLEAVEVYAWDVEAMAWVFLGTADNLYHATNQNTTYELDLGSLESTQLIKIVDVTDPALHNSTADGYDLQCVQALNSCVEYENETAWGNGYGFPGNNWAMYFNYTVQEDN